MGKGKNVHFIFYMCNHLLSFITSCFAESVDWGVRGLLRVTMAVNAGKDIIIG